MLSEIQKQSTKNVTTCYGTYISIFVSHLAPDASSPLQLSLSFTFSSPSDIIMVPLYCYCAMTFRTLSGYSIHLQLPANSDFLCSKLLVFLLVATQGENFSASAICLERYKALTISFYFFQIESLQDLLKRTWYASSVPNSLLLPVYHTSGQAAVQVPQMGM